MINLKKTLFVSIALLVCNFSFGQLSKASCEEILGDVDIKSYTKLKVVTNAVQDNASASVINFEVESSKIFFNSDYLLLKDATGLSISIPYPKITLIKLAPKMGGEYSNIAIYLMD